MKISKIISFIYVGFFVLIFLLCAMPDLQDTQMNPFDYARITDVEYQAVLNDDYFGETRVQVTERLTFDIHAASRSNLYWELWRDLPEDSTDGLSARYQVQSVTEIRPDGGRIPYPESPQLYWDDSDFESTRYGLGPGKWYHSPGPYNEDARQYECVFFYVDGLYREEVVYEVVYDIYNVALKYNDCCDLYLYPYYGTTINYLDSFKGEILIPDADMPSEGNYDVFTYGTYKESFPIKESDTRNPGYHTFYFDLDKKDLKFKPYNEFLEFELVAYGEDYDIFVDSAPDNYYSDEDVLGEIFDEHHFYATVTGKYRVYKLIALAIAIVLSIFVVLMMLRVDHWISGKHIFYYPTKNADYYRDIPSDLDPYFAAELVHCRHKKPKDDSAVYSAILLSLARKKYVRLQEMSNDVAIFILQNPKSKENISISDQYIMYDDNLPEPLTPSEETYFNLLVRHTIGDSILMSTLQNRITNDYHSSITFASDMKNTITYVGTSQGYFQKMDYREPQKQIKGRAILLLVIGLISMVVCNPVSYFTRMDFIYGGYFLFGLVCIGGYIYLNKISRKYLLLTAFGEEEYQKWRSLYNYLNSEASMNERTLVDLPIWEKYLVYATAFGISEKIIKTISIRCPEFDNTTTYRGSGYRSRHFHHHTGRSFHSSVRSGSYSGGGGGYGGGRGGGGGGGGH